MAEKFEDYDRYKFAMVNIHDIVWELVSEMIGRNIIKASKKRMDGTL